MQLENKSGGWPLSKLVEVVTGGKRVSGTVIVDGCRGGGIQKVEGRKRKKLDGGCRQMGFLYTRGLGGCQRLVDDGEVVAVRDQ